MQASSRAAKGATRTDTASEPAEVAAPQPQVKKAAQSAAQADVAAQTKVAAPQPLAEKAEQPAQADVAAQAAVAAPQPQAEKAAALPRAQLVDAPPAETPKWKVRRPPKGSLLAGQELSRRVCLY